MKRNFFTLTCLIFAFALVLPLKIYSQNFAELEKTIKDELKEKNAAGAAVAIVKGDQVIFAKGFGTANVETDQPVTPQTLFQIGSVTKPFTAALILQMAAAKKLDLDAPIGVYAKNLDPQLARITLAGLLSQTSGLIDEPDEFGAGDESLMATYINSWTGDYALLPPSEVFSYSNSGYALAGFTAQEQSGKLFADLMNERIFQPFGMNSSTFRPTVAMTYPLAVGHELKDKVLRVVRPLPQDARLYPAGTFYSNLDDLSRFARAFLNDGKIDGKQIIAPEIIKLMSQPRARQLSASDDTSYGFGFFINTNRGARQIWHDGTMTGYVALLKFIPEQKLALIILGNTNNVGLIKTHDKILEMFAKLKPKDEFKSQPALPMTESEMKKYVGTYTQPRRWISEVFIRDGKLFIKELGQEMEMSKIGENRFSFQFPNAPRPLTIYIQTAQNDKPAFLHQYVWAFKKIK